MLSIYLYALDEIAMDGKSVLLLPGATAWSEQKHGAAVQKAEDFFALMQSLQVEKE